MSAAATAQCWQPWLARTLSLWPARCGLAALAPALAQEHEGPAPPRAEVVVLRARSVIYDKGQLQRGFKVYQEVCAVCHGMKYVAFRNLAPGGSAISEAQVKAIAAEYKIQDGPNDQGEMFERAGRPADYFPTPLPNENAARARYNGVPPDMSVLAKARSYERGFPWFIFDIFTQFQEQGVDYIQALLTATRISRRPASRCRAGSFYNEYFPGHAHRHAAAALRQAGRLHRRLAGDGRPILQGRRGVPDVGGRAALEARKRIGFQVMIFLIVLSGLLYFTKKKVWPTSKSRATRERENPRVSTTLMRRAPCRLVRLRTHAGTMDSIDRCRSPVIVRERSA